MSSGSGPAAAGWQRGDVQWDSQSMQAAGKSAAGSASPSAAADDSGKRRRRRFVNPDSCQVQGCQMPLELAYHRKYHICGDHFKAPCVAIDGQNLRFCQKCGRFQPLSEFQGTKRTCQRALDSHNARRRKREEAKRTASPTGGKGGGDASPSEQRQQRQRPHRSEQQEQQRSGSGGSTGSASGRRGRPHAGDGSSARAGSGGTPGVACPSPEELSGGAAAAGGQQGSPSSPGATEGPSAAAAAAPARSSHSAPQAPPAGPQAQALPPPFEQQQRLMQPTLAAWQVPPVQQVQAGWQQSLGGPELEHSSHGQQGESSLLAQHGSGSFYSAGGQTQPSSGVQPTGSGQTQPGSSPFAAAGLPPLQLGAGGAGGSGFYSHAPGLPTHSNGAALVSPGQQLRVGWQASAAPPVPQLQPWGVAAVEHPAAMSMPMLHPGSTGPISMPALAPNQALPVQQQVSCAGAAFAPVQAASAPPVAAGVGPIVDDMREGIAEGPPPISPLLGCLMDGSELGKWDIHSAVASSSFASPLGAPLAGSRAGPAQDSPSVAALEAAGVHPHAAATVAGVAAETYISPVRLHRMSLKIFGCSPDQLGPGIRAELEAVLQESAGLIEASIRPGCTHLTANLHLGQGGGGIPSGPPAAEVLQRLLTPEALGAAAGNPVLLQWQGQLAATRGGGAPVGSMDLPEPRLLVRPACVLAPLPGQPWPLVQLQLRAAGEGGGAAAATEGGLAACMQQSSVLCRQAGRHLPVEVWGTTAAAAAAALSWAPTLREPPRSEGSGDSSGSEGGGSGSGSEPASTTSSRSVLLRDASIKSSDSEEEAADPEVALPELAPAVVAAGGSADASPPAALRLWVRPVGLRPGCCEMEMQVQLPCALPGADAGDGPCAVLLSRPAPLLVMRDAAAAREVQALVRASGRTGAECFDDLLRDVGTAVAFLEQQQQPAGDVESPIPPGFAAAAAHAAAECAHHRGMPALAALLQRALAAARAAVAAAAVPDSQAAGEALEGAGCSKAKLLAAGEEAAAVKPLQPSLTSKAGKAAGDGQGSHVLGLLGPCSRFGTRSSAAVKAEAMLAEHVGSGGQPTSLPWASLLRLCAVLAAIFVGVMAHRLALQGAAA